MHQSFAKDKNSASYFLLFFCTVLVFGFFFLADAQATEIEDLAPGSIKPPHHTVAVDSRGVDMVSGMHSVPGMRVSIGSNESGLINDPGSSRYNMHSHVGTIEKIVINNVITATNGKAYPYAIGLPVGQYYKVDMAGASEILSASSGLSVSGDGGGITCSSSECVYTDKYGTVSVFNMQLCNVCTNTAASGSNQFYNDGLVSKVTKPDGEVLQYFYLRHGHYVRQNQQFDMPSAVMSSLGWMLKYYFSDVIPQAGDAWGAGNRSVTALNSRLEYCNPSIWQCQFASNWPVSRMDIEGKTWVSSDGRSYTFTERTKITAPGDTKADYHSMHYGMFNGNAQQTYRTPEGIESSYTIAGYWYNTAYSRFETTYADGVNKVLTSTIAGQQSNYDFKVSSVISGPDGSYAVDTTYGRLLSFTDKLNRTTSYEYSGGYKNRITKVTVPDGSYTTYTYDERGNITFVRRYPAGGGSPLVTRADYWSCNANNKKYCNKPLSITDPSGAITSYTYYAEHGGVNTITKPSVSVVINGITQSVAPEIKHYYEAFNPYSYDKTGLFKASDVSIYRQTKVTQCRTASSCAGSEHELVKTTHYDVNENLLPDYKIIAAGDGSISLRTNYEYDIYGNEVKKIGPHPKNENYTFYDLQQRVVGVIGPDSNGEGRIGGFTQYNADGQVTYTKNGSLSGVTLFALQSMEAETEETTSYNFLTGLAGRTVKDGKDIDPLVTDMSYDSEFRLECEAVRMNVYGNASLDPCSRFAGTFGFDRVTKYEYDATSALKRVTTGYGLSEQRVEIEHVYNSKGQVEKKIDGNGNVTKYDYDSFGRTQQVSYPSSTSVGYANTSDYTFTTYEGTLVKNLRLRNGTTITFAYDNWGRTTAKTAASNGTFGGINESFGYDNFNNLTSHNNTSTGIASTTLIADFNILGGKKYETTALGSVSYGYDEYARRNRLTWPDGFYVTYDYGTSLLLQHIKENGTTTLVSSGYDKFGRRDTLSRANGITTTYGYNSISRLTSINTSKLGSVNAGDYAASFGYNLVGQVTSKTESVRNSPGASYFYSRQVESQSYTPNGLNQITNWSGTTISHDTNGNTNAIGSTSYTYNNDNLLLTAGGAQLSYDSEKRLYKAGSSCFLYDGEVMIAETNCSGTVLNRYVHGSKSDNPIVWYIGSGTASKRYYTEDFQGGIIGITNDSGSVYAINSYDEYGIPAATNIGRFQFTGQVWLAEVGLYYYKARFYHPRLGRFMQTDPIGYEDGMNWYAYVGNDPVNSIDPSGMAACPANDPSCIDDPASESGNEEQPPPSEEQREVEEVVVIGYRNKEMSDGTKIRFPSSGGLEQGFKVSGDGMYPLPFSRSGTQTCSDGSSRAANSINIAGLGGASIGHTHGGGGLDPLPGPEDGVAAAATGSPAYMMSRAGAFSIESTSVGFRVRQLAGKSLSSRQAAAVQKTVADYNKNGGGSGVKCTFKAN